MPSGNEFVRIAAGGSHNLAVIGDTDAHGIFNKQANCPTVANTVPAGSDDHRMSAASAAPLPMAPFHASGASGRARQPAASSSRPTLPGAQEPAACERRVQRAIP